MDRSMQASRQPIFDCLVYSRTVQFYCLLHYDDSPWFGAGFWRTIGKLSFYVLRFVVYDRCCQV